MQTSPRSGLVLGGGGITGIGWELGMLAGLAEAGVDLLGADLIVGTSAGSVVGAQITSGTPIEELYRRQLEPPSAERPVRLGPRVKLAYLIAFIRSRGELTRFGRQLGALSTRAAASGRLPSLEQRLAVIASRLPSPEWPERDLLVTAIDARTGVFRVIAKPDGVALADAVAASCAVPGVYPPVPIGDRTYIDGGYRSGANADLARGCSRVVVLAPVARAAQAGRAQAAHCIDQIRAVWGESMLGSLSACRRVVCPPWTRSTLENFWPENGPASRRRSPRSKAMGRSKRPIAPSLATRAPKTCTRISSMRGEPRI
jgi:NTE family protein